MNSEQIEKIKRLEEDSSFRIRNTLKIKNKEGKLVPFETNKVQRYIEEQLEEQKREAGRVRAIILKGRKQGCCLATTTRVLTSDYNWITLQDIKVGDKLLAFDEFGIGKTKSGKKCSRKLKTTVVEAKQFFEEEALEILFDNGVNLKVTPNHRFLSRRRSGVEPVWREAGEFKIGDVVRVITRAPDYNPQSYEDGWIGGILDGEGSMRGKYGKGSKRLSIHQVEGDVLTRVKKYLLDRDIPYKEVIDRRPYKGKVREKPCHRLDVHRLPYIIEILSKCRPSRFIERDWHSGHELPGKAATDGIKPWAKVISITPIGKRLVVDIQTSEKTFICEGLASHNSTLIAGRFFDRMMREEGVESFILAHREDTVGTLYDIVGRFYENYPDAKIIGKQGNIICKQSITEENAKRFAFANGSGYTIGTSGKGEIGRGFTIQQLHLSEAAFYENGEAISSGIMEAVPDSEGTEIIVESTANGIGGLFHSMVMKANQGLGSYKLIFIPWFWQEEYRKPVPDNFTLTDEEISYKSLYKLDDEQIYWRRKKIEDSDDGIVQFRREFPATVKEAFDTSNEASYFDVLDMEEAMNAPTPPGKNKVICGLDIAGDGANPDRIVFSLRRGREQFKTIVYKKLSSEELILRAKEIIRTYKVYKMFVDKGFNPAICEFLQRDFPSKVIGVYFGGGADEPLKYLNKRAEMIARARMWLRDKPVKMVNSASMAEEMLAIRKVEKKEPNEKIQFISKKEIRENIGISTDEFDAFILTFAYLVEDYEDIDLDELEEDPEITHGCKITGY